MTNTLNKEVEQEVKEVHDQFVEFLHTKGISAKFKLAFSNMKESAKEQHKKDVASFNEVKEKSAKENKEFVEFLQTKGFKAKVNLVIENIKKGAREANQKTKEQIAKSKELGNPHRVITAEDLSREFNTFLKSKGLDSKYTITIEEK